MQEQWRIRITGNKRKEVDVNLLIQAVIALGKQFAEEDRVMSARHKTEEVDDTASSGGSS